MNSRERVNQYLAEQMGIYRHDSLSSELPGGPDFFTPEGFFKLIKWMQKSNILTNWLSVQVRDTEDPHVANSPCDGSWLDPGIFPEQLAQYLGFAAAAK